MLRTTLPVLFSLLPAVALAQNTVVATVNGKPVTESMVQAQMDSIPQGLILGRQDEVRKAVIDRLVEQEVILQQARKAKLEDSDAFKEQLATMRNELLMNLFLQKQMESRITDKAVKDYYDKNGADYAYPAVHAAHILVEDQDAAEDIIKKLNKGAKFDDLAKQFSIGPSASKGGDLGWFGRGAMVPSFENTAFAMKAGDISQAPVQTQFGWHIIKVLDKNDAYIPPLSEVEGEVRESLANQVYANYMEKLKADADIKYTNQD